jgi:acylphosphatase
MQHFNITVTGKVQGIFFRHATNETAQQLGVKGFVKNESNGNVYIEAEGEEGHLNQLVEWCKKGPPKARVAQVSFSEGEIKNYTSFEIRR